MRARAGAGTGMKVEMMVEERESLGTYEVVVEMDLKTRQRERRQ